MKEFNGQDEFNSQNATLFDELDANHALNESSFHVSIGEELWSSLRRGMHRGMITDSGADPGGWLNTKRAPNLRV